MSVSNLSLNLSSVIANTNTSTDEPPSTSRLRVRIEAIREGERIKLSPRCVGPLTVRDMTGISPVYIRECTKQRNRLRNLFACLEEANFSENRYISFTRDGEFRVTSKRPSSMRIFNVILEQMRFLMDFEIEGFFDDNGLYISTPSLVGWLKVFFHKQNASSIQKNFFNLYMQNLTNQNPVAQKALSWKQVNKLSLPKTLHKLNKNERIVAEMLMRLCPEKDSKVGISLRTLLATYTRFITAERMFFLIKQLVMSGNREFPLIQKMRLLNFCRCWISSGMFTRHCSSDSVRTAIQEVINETVKIDHQMLRQQAEELKIMLFDINFLNTVSNGSKKPFSATVGELVNDLRILTIRLFLDVEPQESMTPENETIDKLSKHFNQLRVEIQRAICTKIEEKVESARTQEEAAPIFEYFVDVAYQLYKMRDYQTSVTIFSALTPDWICKRFVNEHSARPRSGSIIERENNLERRWRILSRFFNPERRYKVISDHVQQHLRKGEECIPYIEVMLNDMARIQDGNKDETEEGVNVGKLDLLSRSIWTLNSFQQKLFIYWNDLSKPVRLHTKIKLQLQKKRSHDEARLYEISKSWVE